MRILVLEDELFVALHLEEELRAAGHDVVGPAASLADAHALAGQHAIDFAILDANLHGKTPKALAEELVQRSVPFAYLTGYDEAYIRAADLPDGPLLPKPLQQHELTRLLREATERATASEQKPA